VNSVKRLAAAVLDTSAIFSVFEQEAGAPAFLEAFSRCDQLLMSAGTLAELSILMMSRAGSAGAQALDNFLVANGVEIVEVDRHLIESLFRSGFMAFGKGMGNLAKLNYGDLFAYALACERKLPLFFQGLDFKHADLKNAMSELGYAINRKGEPRITRRAPG
jgi:ribonuclease VapC